MGPDEIRVYRVVCQTAGLHRSTFLLLLTHPPSLYSMTLCLLKKNQVLLDIWYKAYVC